MKCPDSLLLLLKLTRQSGQMKPSSDDILGVCVCSCERMCGVCIRVGMHKAKARGHQ